MHWSVAVTVLGATLLMACIRAYVRRSIAANPQVVGLEEGGELSWLAMEALGLELFALGIPASEERTEAGDTATPTSINNPDGDAVTAPPRALSLSPQIAASILARKAVEVRQELTNLASWQDEHTVLAHQLAEAIAGTLEYVLGENAFEVDPTTTHSKVGGRDTKRWPRRDEEIVSDPLGTMNPFHAILDYVATDSERIIGEELPEEEVTQLPEFVVRELSSRKRARNNDEDASASPREPPGQGPPTAMDKPSRGEVFMAELNNDVGFTVDFVGPADLELSFAWEVDIRLTATQLEGSQMVKLGHSAHTAVGGRFPPGPDELPVEPGAWNVDPSPLAALLSLCALTMESEPNSSHVACGCRTLGCGWDVPVPARCVDPGIEVDSEELRRWLSEQREARSNADTPEGRQVKVSTPNDVTESSIDGRDISTIDERDRVSPSSDIGSEGFGRYIRHRMEVQNGPGSVRVVDFYKIWIERETPSKTIADIENLDDRDDLWRAPAFDRNRRPLTKEYKYMFGAPFAIYSRCALTLFLAGWQTLT
jgi:hypothetical protein